MQELESRLALHAWTLETTALADVLRVARETGWNAVERRRSDFVRLLEVLAEVCADAAVTSSTRENPRASRPPAG